MTTPASGPISLQDVNKELAQSTTATIGLGGGLSRNLAGVYSGQIKLSDLYNKSLGSGFGSGLVNALLVAGGGGGGTGTRGDNRLVSGGGGAGGMIIATLQLIQGTYPVVIGGGGGSNGNGGNSTFGGVIAIGGGTGGRSDSGGGFADLKNKQKDGWGLDFSYTPKESNWEIFAKYWNIDDSTTNTSTGSRWISTGLEPHNVTYEIGVKYAF